MILLESDQPVDILRKNGTITTKIYALGDFLQQTKTHLTFREVYYFIEQFQEKNPMKGEGEPEFITVEKQIILPESIEKHTMPLKVKDFGDNPTPEELQYNSNAIDFLFQQFGSNITKSTKEEAGTGYSRGVEQNFNNIFYMVQMVKKHYGVQKWKIIEQSI